MARDRADLLRSLSAFFLLSSFCVFWFSDTVADPDLWGHVRFGRDMLLAGSIVQADTYSYRAGGQTWINHEWLSEVIFAAIYDRSGPRGLIVFKFSVSVLIVGLSHAHLRRRGLGPWSSAFLLVLIGVPFRMGMATVRPQIFTYLLFLFLLLLLESARERRCRRLWALPVLFAVWVNLHGGVLAGMGASRRWAAALHLVLLGTTCGLALVLNPYGAELVRFLLRTATAPRPEIREWAPLDLSSLPGLLYLGLLAIGVFGLTASRRPIGLEVVALFCVTAALALIANRHCPLFALTLVVLVGEHIADAGKRCRPRLGSRLGESRVFATISLAVSLLLIGLSPPRFACIRVDPYYFGFPARAVALLKRSGATENLNLAVPFDWGEYVLWHLGPGAKVSMDGRRETVYSDEVYRQSRDFERGTGAWDALLKSGPRTDLVLAPNGSPTVNLLSRTSGWLALYQDTFCVIFIREDCPGLERLARTSVPVVPDNGDGLCFPGPGRADGNRGG
jgi:hypothetical protein